MERQLRSRCNDPLDDHRLDQVAHAALHLRQPLQRATEPKLANHAAHRGHLSVRQGANDLEAVIHGLLRVQRRHLAAGDEPTDAVDQRLRQLRQIGQRALLDPAALSITLAQQDRRRRLSVRDRVDEHVREESLFAAIGKSHTWTQCCKPESYKTSPRLNFKVADSEKFGLGLKQKSLHYFTNYFPVHAT